MKSLLIIASLFLYVHLSAQIPGIDLVKHSDELVLDFKFENGFIILPIKYNRFLSLNFILDTGAEHTILFNKQLNDILGLPYDKRVELIGSDLSQIIYALISRNVPIKLNETLTVQRDIVVLEEDLIKLEELTGLSIDGILGASFFKNLILHIDYKNEKLHFHHPEKFNFKKIRKHSKHSLEIIGHKPYLNVNLTMHNDENLDAKLLIDTGAGIPFLFHQDVDSNLVMPPNIITGNLGSGLGGIIEGYVGKMPKIIFANYNFKDPISYFQKLNMDWMPEQMIIRNGLVGNKVLSRFDLYLDYFNKNLYLKPNKKFNDAFNYDRSGLILFAHGNELNKFYVRHVVEDSPAFYAGILPGDIIKRIGIWNSKIYSLEKITKKLSGKEGKKIRLTIDRNGKKLKKQFVLKNLF